MLHQMEVAQEQKGHLAMLLLGCTQSLHLSKVKQWNRRKRKKEKRKITSLQQFLEIVYAFRKSHHFFIQLDGARSWKTISREDSFDKDGQYKLHIINDNDGSSKIVTIGNLTRCTNIVQAIMDGNFYQLDME